MGSPALDRTVWRGSGEIFSRVRGWRRKGRQNSLSTSGLGQGARDPRQPKVREMERDRLPSPRESRRAQGRKDTQRSPPEGLSAEARG